MNVTMITVLLLLLLLLLLGSKTWPLIQRPVWEILRDGADLPFAGGVGD